MILKTTRRRKVCGVDVLIDEHFIYADRLILLNYFLSMVLYLMYLRSLLFAQLLVIKNKASDTNGIDNYSRPIVTAIYAKICIF